MVLYRLAFAFSLMMPPPPRPTLFPYTTLFRSMLASFDPDALEQKFERYAKRGGLLGGATKQRYWELYRDIFQEMAGDADDSFRDRKSTRLNSSHEWISYAVFCLKKKKKK